MTGTRSDLGLNQSNAQPRARLSGWRSRLVAPVLIAFAFLILPSSAESQGVAAFDRLLTALDRTAERDQRPLITAFITAQRARGGFPIRDRSGVVVFVYVAEEPTAEVRVVGDFLTRSVTSPYWDASGTPLTRIGPLFYVRRTFEPDARLDYRFVVDGVPTRDPLNPRTIFSGAGNGEASELSMPLHRAPDASIKRGGIAHGTVTVVREAWATPTVTVYVPPHYDPTRRYPTLYTADGSAWRLYIGLPTALDTLIAARRIEPVLAVMIDAPENRGAWYHCNPEYVTYLQQVVTYIDAHYSTRADPASRVHVGTSAGGKATLHVGVEQPMLFGNLGLLSPSLSPEPECLAPYASDARRLPRARTWITAGTYEGAILADARAWSDRFRTAGAPVSMRTAHQGHSFGAWREAAVEMLQFFFGH